MKGGAEISLHEEDQTLPASMMDADANLPTDFPDEPN
jgi:hypothetical protein